MPELPEVEVLRRSLAARLIGRRVRDVAVHAKALREPLDRRRLASLRGGRVTGLRRRAKYLWIDFEGGRTLVVHLGMSGRLTLETGRSPREPHVHLELLLAGGGRLRLRDPRRFGVAFVAATSRLAADRHFLPLGREPLDGSLGGRELAALAAGKRGPVKGFLMDGRNVVGIGNIYASEALFRAGIHPSRSVSRLAPARWDRLARAVVEVLEGAIREGGTTLNDFSDGDGNEGYFQVSLAVYDRAGEPCPRCATPIRRTVHSGRSTFYCPSCQR